MLVRALDEQGDGLRVFDFLNKGVFLLAKSVFVDQPRPAENRWIEIIDAVLCGAATDELKAFHIAALGASEGENAILDKYV